MSDLMNWTQEEKMSYYNQYGIWPEQLIGNRAVKVNAPPVPPFESSLHDISRLRARETPEFSPTDIQGRAAQMASDIDYQKALSQEEMDAEYAKEYANVSALNTFARMAGIRTSSMPARQSLGGRGGAKATDPDKIANNEFLKHFYSTIKQIPGNKMSPQEVLMFLDSTQATPDQVASLMKLKEFINLDGIKQLQRINNQQGENFGKVEYKYVWEYKPEDAAAGWKTDRADLKFQREVNKDLAAEELSTKKTELYQRLINLPAYSEDGIMVPRNREQYDALAKALDLKTPEEFGILEERFKHLLKPSDKKTATVVENNRRISKRMTEYELETENKKRTREGKSLWAFASGGASADLNKANIANLIDLTIQTGTTPSGPPGTPLAISNFAQAFEAASRAVANDPTVVVEDWKAFQDQVEARWNKAYKDGERITNMENLANKGLTDEKVSGREATWNDLMAYQEKHGITGDAAKRMSEQWLQSPHHKAYDGPDFLYTDWGVASPPLYTRQDYLNYKEQYPVESWDAVKHKPMMALDTGKMNNTDRLWRAVGNERRWKKELNGGKGGYELVPVDEWRYTDGYETRVQTAYRERANEQIAVWKKGTEDIGLILEALMSRTGPMDGVVLKKVEKMLDPTGVVRQSDIEFWEGLSSLRDRLEHIVGKALNPAKSHVLPDQLRMELGAAVKLIHDRLSKHSIEDLGYVKEAYTVEADEYKTFSGGRLGWNKVIPPSQWTKLQNYNTGEVHDLYNDLVSKHGGVNIPITDPLEKSKGKAKFAVPADKRKKEEGE